MIFEQNSMISIAYGVVKRFFAIGERSFFSKNADEEPNGHIVEKQLRCTVSSCFDKQNICCKACDIKNCRYKCNFMDKEVCEHEFK